MDRQSSDSIITEIKQKITGTEFERYIDQPRWLVWRYKPSSRPNRKPLKVPFDPLQKSWSGEWPRNVDGEVPESWYTLDQLEDWETTRGWPTGWQLGFGIKDGDDLYLIDLDDSIRADGSLTTFADLVTRDFVTLTERSPSGGGLHLWARGKLPDIRPKNKGGYLEVYPTPKSPNKWVTFTGDFDPEQPRTATRYVDQTMNLLAGDYKIAANVIDDPEDEENAILWSGDYGRLPHLGSESASEGDSALMRRIALHTPNRDKEQMIRVFKLSGAYPRILEREKADPDDYLDRTADYAIEAAKPKRGRPRKDQSRDREEAVWNVVPLSSVEMEATFWLLENRISLNAVSELIGDPDLGKSTIAFKVAAGVSRGIVGLPDGSQSDLTGPGNVLILSSEDDPSRTIRPRLEAMGADVSRCHILEIKHDKHGVMQLEIPDDIERLRRVVQDHDIKLIVIDPLVAYLSDEIDSHRDAQVRRALGPLAELAEAESVAILCVRHLNKNSKEHNAKYRGGGSIAFTAAVRTSNVVGIDEATGQYVLACVKNNIGPHPRSLTYKLDRRVVGTKNGREIVGSFVEWGNVIDITGDELLATKKESGTKSDVLDKAKGVIYPLIEHGPAPVSVIARAIEDAGLSWETIKTQRNRERLGVESCRMEDDQGKKTIRAWKFPLYFITPQEDEAFPQGVEYEAG